MAKLYSSKDGHTKELVRRNRKHMTDMHSSPHVRFLETAPIFVTLYNQNLIESMSSIGFKDVQKTTGANSAMRFDKVDNFPIFLSDKVNKTTDKDEEIGWGEMLTGSAVALPKTVKLNKGDMFVVDYAGTEVWFEITNAPSTAKVKSNDYQYFEFELKRSVATPGEIVIDPSHVVEEFECLYDNIGTEFKTIIRKTDSEKISLMMNKVELMNDLVMSEFYFNTPYRHNLLLHDIEEGTVAYISPLIKFVNDNKVLTLKGSYWMANGNDVTKARRDLRNYNKTIFNGIVTRDHDMVGVTLQRAPYISDSVYSPLNSVLDCDSLDVINYEGAEDIDVLDKVFDNLSDNTFDTVGYECILKHMRSEYVTEEDLDKIISDITDIKSFTRTILVIYVLRTQVNELMFDNTLEIHV